MAQKAPVRLYDTTKARGKTLVLLILGAHAIAAGLWVLLGMALWWVLFLFERPRLQQSYGDSIDYRPDVWHSLCAGATLLCAAGFLAAALIGSPASWFGFGAALGLYTILSCWHYANVKENPRHYGWD